MGSLSLIIMLPFMFIFEIGQNLVEWLQTVTLSEALSSGIDWITQFFQNTDFNAVGNGIGDFISQIAFLF